MVFSRSSEQQKIAQKYLRKSSVQSIDKVSKPDKENKYYLRHSLLRTLPMLPIQEARINAALAQKKDTFLYLSPKQLKLLKIIIQHKEKDWPTVINQPFKESFKKTWARIQP